MRKQAKMTLRCMQALVRVQARVLDQRVRLSQETNRKSTFSDANSVWESRYLQDISDRKSMVSLIMKVSLFFTFSTYFLFLSVSNYHRENKAELYYGQSKLMNS